MKKLLFLLVAISLLAACNRDKTPKLDEFTVNTLTVSDSVQFPEDDLEDWNFYDKAYYTCQVDEPVTKNQALKDSILTWMRHQMIDTVLPGSNSILDLMKAERDISLDLENTEPGYMTETYLMLKEVADRYVTYSEDSYLYFGGAHGMPFYYCATFDRLTGTRFSFRMFKNLNALSELVEKGLIDQHFDPVFQDEENYNLKDMLLLGEYEIFPLPSTDPWIENDSVHFIYSPYEIAAFAAGMPECAFPYSVIEKFLTEEGKAFFQ